MNAVDAPNEPPREPPAHPVATPSPEPTPPQPPSPLHVPDDENPLIEKPDAPPPAPEKRDSAAARERAGASVSLTFGATAFDARHRPCPMARTGRDVLNVRPRAHTMLATPRRSSMNRIQRVAAVALFTIPMAVFAQTANTPGGSAATGTPLEQSKTAPAKTTPSTTQTTPNTTNPSGTLDKSKSSKSKGKDQTEPADRSQVNPSSTGAPAQTKVPEPATTK